MHCIIPLFLLASCRKFTLKTSYTTTSFSINSMPLFDEHAIVVASLIAAISLLPFIALLTTSFMKITVVFSIMRNAIGTAQIPPNYVLTGVALLLTTHIMSPVVSQTYDCIKEAFIALNGQNNAPLSLPVISLLIQQCKTPFTEFLSQHCHTKEQSFFLTYAKQRQNPSQSPPPSPLDLSILVPAFVTSQLKEAFQMGFLIYLPFLVIDMIVANILTSLGMFMLSPTQISLPFKLLLMISVDGWLLIIRALLLTYQ